MLFLVILDFSVSLNWKTEEKEGFDLCIIIIFLLILAAETWPFLITLLMKCISLEVSASKKRLPRLIFVKTLRSSIQCAEDIKLSGIQEWFQIIHLL